VPTEPDPSGTLLRSYLFNRSGDTLIIGYDDTINHYCSCQDSTLACTTAVVKGDTDTVICILSGDTLYLETGTDASNLFQDTSVVIRYFFALKRIGGGSGIEGLWQVFLWTYRLIAGTLTSQEKIAVDQAIAAQSNSDYFRIYDASMQVLFRGGRMSTYNAVCPADDWMYQVWCAPVFGSANNADSARFNVQVSRLGCDSMRLYGVTSAETVWLSWDQEENLTYRSSDTAHAMYTWSADPQTCPNRYEAAWYYSEFLLKNLKPLAKAAAGEDPITRSKAGSLPQRLGVRPNLWHYSGWLTTSACVGH
jgi:hypothetical protein